VYHLLRFLRDRGCIIAGNHGAASIEEELQRFDAYLERTCGLASETRQVRTYLIVGSYARVFRAAASE
jgi:hypothetical protein